MSEKFSAIGREAMAGPQRRDDATSVEIAAGKGRRSKLDYCNIAIQMPADFPGVCDLNFLLDSLGLAWPLLV